MVAVPTATPVTSPDGLTKADTLPLHHMPPGEASVNGVDEPTQTEEAPLMVPATGSGLTVAMVVATAVPHMLVTE